jgi:hypothetical protein
MPSDACTNSSRLSPVGGMARRPAFTCSSICRIPAILRTSGLTSCRAKVSLQGHDASAANASMPDRSDCSGTHTSSEWCLRYAVATAAAWANEGCSRPPPTLEASAWCEPNELASGALPPTTELRQRVAVAGPNA